MLLPLCCSTKMRISITSALLLLSPLAAEAFVPTTPTTIKHAKLSTEMEMAPKSRPAQELARAFGTVTAAAILAANVGSASAVPTVSTSISSSSVQVAESVKTFDMSLPSYDSVLDAKKGVMNVKGVEATNGGSLGLTSKSGENALYKKKAPDAKKAVAAQKQEEEREEKLNEKIKIVDMAMPSYDTSSSVKKNKLAL
uniref:Uncharacterized protein n=1 Tax=Trieres chinensis TaxID=1514140 RepID=A0A7S2EWJ8_TRICV